MTGKGIISLIKSRDKLRTSVEKLKAEVKAAVDLALTMPTSKIVDEDILKKMGLLAKDYRQFAGEDKINPDLVYKALSGKKRLFSQFDSHLKDIVALAYEIHVGILSVEKKQGGLRSIAREIKPRRAVDVLPTRRDH